MINYAHRGASEYAPENTFSAFYLGLEMGADGIETDVRMTRDGKLVLFHDGVLDRVTDRSGAFHDVSYEQLKAMKITGKNPDAVPDCIVTLEDFLKMCIRDSCSARKLSISRTAPSWALWTM